MRYLHAQSESLPAENNYPALSPAVSSLLVYRCESRVAHGPVLRSLPRRLGLLPKCVLVWKKLCKMLISLWRSPSLLLPSCMLTGSSQEPISMVWIWYNFPWIHICKSLIPVLLRLPVIDLFAKNGFCALFLLHSKRNELICINDAISPSFSGWSMPSRLAGAGISFDERISGLLW